MVGGWVEVGQFTTIAVPVSPYTPLAATLFQELGPLHFTRLRQSRSFVARSSGPPRDDEVTLDASIPYSLGMIRTRKESR
jgi:hypothetical protein